MKFCPSQINRRLAAFTMVEIAICLAIIGLALVAIIGVLPVGMNVQRDNREETVINQDASVLLESIRNGGQAGTDLTNYVYAITNYWVHFVNVGGVIKQDNAGYNGFDYANKPTFTGTPAMFASPANLQLTNNGNIIGTLSTPEFLNGNLVPINNIITDGSFFSNHVVAYVRAISGPSVEKPPQDNPLLVDSSFTYRIVVDNGPQAMDTNFFNVNLPASEQKFSQQMAANLHELRLAFYWPVQPNGSIGTGRQTQRTMIAGSIVQTNVSNGLQLYYYQSQSFTNTPYYP